MYSYEEKCVMNFGDCYALLYGYIARRLTEEYGRPGEKAVREATRRFGVDRATATRNKHLAVGAKINMLNLFTLYHDLPSDPRFRRELQEINPQERVSHTLVCPMADVWNAHGQRAIGRIYCEEFHPACYSAYAYGYTQVNLAKTLTQEGDEYCAFNVVLRPENLPQNLRSLCFEDYDPAYVVPDFPLQESDKKKGFNMLSIKLYSHLLQTAIEQLGETAGQTVETGLRDFAQAVAQMLRGTTSESGLKIDAAYVADNVPVEMDTSEPLWEQYGHCQAKQRMQTHFCEVLLQELKIST